MAEDIEAIIPDENDKKQEEEIQEETEKEKFARERLYLLKELENYECNNADRENLRHISSHDNLKLLIKFKAKKETNRMYN